MCDVLQVFAYVYIGGAPCDLLSLPLHSRVLSTR